MLKRTYVGTVGMRPLAYQVCGSGPDVILLHGLFCSGAMWDKLMADLSPYYRVWAIDLLGFGKSTVTGEPVTLEAQAEAVIQFLGDDIHPVAIIGHSLGGTIALKVALLQPELQTKIVLIAPVITGRLPMSSQSIFKSALGIWVVRNSKPIWKAVMALGWRALLTDQLPLNDYQRVISDFRMSSWEGVFGSALGVSRLRILGRLDEIAQSTLLIHGSLDDLTPVSESQLAVTAIPDARLITLVGCHHSPTDEQPDAVHQAIKEFLS